jgi:RNA polymerase sigma-70 factor (ECF subfamily)
MEGSREEVTKLLTAWRQGDREAFDRLLPMVYDELRAIAHRYIRREHSGDTLQTTALVHEAYLKLLGGGRVDWQDRQHFFAVCANVMRHLLVDRARSRQAAKRGGAARHLGLENAAVAPDVDADLLALNRALELLAEVDQRKARIVELRYFGGLSVDETADVMDLSPITIKREWLKAKAFLYREIKGQHLD